MHSLKLASINLPTRQGLSIQGVHRWLQLHSNLDPSRFFPQVEWSWTIQVLVLPCTHIWRIGSVKAIPNFERCNRRVLHLVQQILAIAEPLNWRRIDVTCSICCSATDCRIKQIQNQVSSARVDWQNVMEHRFRSISFTSSTAQSGGGSFINHKTYRRGWLLWITDGRANPLMDRQVAAIVFFGMVAMVAMVAVV